MRVDAHMHVNYEGYTSDDVVRYLDRHKFDLCWLLTWEEINPQKWPYQQVSVVDIYETYLKHPSRIIPMYAPDPHHDDAPQRLRSWCARGIKGCAELKSAINWNSDKVKRLLSTASEFGLPVLFHMEESSDLVVPVESDSRFEVVLAKVMNSHRLHGLPRRTLEVLASALPSLEHWREQRTIHFPGYMLDFASLGDVLREFPDLNIVGHGPMFWKYLSGDAVAGGPAYPTGPVKDGGLVVEFLEEHDNFYADLSASGFTAMSRDRGFSRRFLDKFSQKILFGSDNIETNLEGLLGSLALPSRALKQILGENAAGLVENAGISQAVSKPEQTVSTHARPVS